MCSEIVQTKTLLHEISESILHVFALECNFFKKEIPII